MEFEWIILIKVHESIYQDAWWKIDIMVTFFGSLVYWRFYLFVTWKKQPHAKSGYLVSLPWRELPLCSRPWGASRTPGSLPTGRHGVAHLERRETSETAVMSCPSHVFDKHQRPGEESTDQWARGRLPYKYVVWSIRRNKGPVGGWSAASLLCVGP